MRTISPFGILQILLLFSYDTSSLIGMLKAQSDQTLVNPFRDTPFEANDHIIAIAKDDSTIHPSVPDDFIIGDNLISLLLLTGFQCWEVKMAKAFGPAYASVEDSSFIAKYRASCYCQAVQIEVCAAPLDAKICHCLTCQRLHGAPMQWAAIFHKHDVRITQGTDGLRFYKVN